MSSSPLVPPVEVPAWIAAFPRADDPVVPCPSCGVVIDPPPKRGRACTACGTKFYVRRCHDDVRRVLTRAGMREVECLWAEHGADDMAVTIHIADSPGELARAKAQTTLELRQRMRAAVEQRHRDEDATR